MIDADIDDDLYTVPIRERFSNPMSVMLRSLNEQDWGRSDPTYLRWLAADMTDLPDERVGCGFGCWPAGWRRCAGGAL